MERRCIHRQTRGDDTVTPLAASVEDFFQRQSSDAEGSGRWHALAAQGWLALRLPEEMGGSGLAALHGAIVAEALGRARWHEPYAAHAVLVASLARSLHGDTDWSDIADCLNDGKHRLAPAWQADPRQLEPAEIGSNAPMTVRDNQLSGRYYGVEGVAQADSLLAYALLGGQPALFEIPITSPGIAYQSAQGSDGACVSTVDLADVRVAAPLAFGARVHEAMRAALDEATLMTAVQLYGVGDAALGATLEHLRLREQFDKPIGSFQSLQHLCVDTTIQLALTRAACRHALEAHGRAPSLPATRATIAAAKARACDAALIASRHGVQLFGAMGYTEESIVGQCLKSALRLSASFGPATAHRRRYTELEPGCD